MYDFKQIEPKIFDFWRKNRILEKVKEKNRGKKKFYFLDGPPYTSGRVHIGTAWNQCLKDQALRYKRMRGFDVWDRGGYDMHGLPTAHKVQAKHNLKDKEDIKKFGVDRFVKECKTYSIKMMKQMNDEFDKLAVSLDHKNPYMTISDEYIEGIWWLVKKAHDNKRLYLGERTMTWCYDCETALAKHELEYKEVKEDSIFVKFKVVGKKNEYLIIWTTTPWTIAFNLGVMVNPELDYVRAKVDNEIWIMAKGLAAPVVRSVANKELKIIEEFKGKKLEGLKYEHPFYNILKHKYDELIKKSNKIFTVVMSKEYVNLSAGTGLVHMAPGCGPEDYEIGRKNGIPPFNNLTEDGFYPDDMGKFSGLNAKKDNQKFIDELEEGEKLIATTKVEHDYAHCWRCKNPVIYRVTKQWFFKIEDLIPKMLEQNKKVKWVPKEVGDKYELWIKNLRDNSVTRQRYWGTPFPLWKCENCEDYIVVGSIKELEKLSGKKPEDLHIPWIDKITIPCKKCKGEMKRMPDVLDVWMDSAVASWACLDYPIRKDLFKKYWPADLILEASEQTRLWYYVMQIASNIAMRKSCYKVVYSHGMLRDFGGEKMSKSLGNIISPDEVTDKYGVDTFRLYSLTAKAGVDLNFSWEGIKLKYRNLDVLLNITNYLIDYCDKVPNSLPKKLEREDKWILSRLNSTIKDVTKLLDTYQLDLAPQLVERLFLDLSREYIKYTRERVNKGDIFKIIYDVLIEVVKMLSITCPHISEHLYLKLKERYVLKEESVFLLGWPEANDKLIDKKLEDNMDLVREIIQRIFAEREKGKVGVRWPLARIDIPCKDPNACKNFEDLIKKQTNIKKIVFSDKIKDIMLDFTVTPELELEGFTREIIRRIQNLRKKAKLKKINRISLFIKGDYDLTDTAEEIMERVGADSLEFSKADTEFIIDFKIKNKGFFVGFNILK